MGFNSTFKWLMSLQRHYPPLTADMAYTKAAAWTPVLTRYNMFLFGRFLKNILKCQISH